MDKGYSLISTDIQELVDILEGKNKEALSNLVRGQTPKEVIFQRPAGKGVNVDYVPGWWFIQQLNALFGYFWDFEIEEQGIGEDSCWVRGKLTVQVPSNPLTKVVKTAFGGCKLKSKGNPAIDIGDDLKAAATDALKKAATLLGMASDIYGKREIQSETGGTKAQLVTLFKVGEDRGLDKKAVTDISTKLFSKGPEELESIDVLALIREVRSRTLPT